MLGLSLIFSGVILWLLVKPGDESAFLPILFITGILFLINILKRSAIILFRFWIRPKTERVRRINQILIEYTALSIMKVSKVIKFDKWPIQQKISLSLIQAVSNQPLHRALIHQIAWADFSSLILIEDIETSLGIKDYEKSIELLKELSLKYGLNSWIYERLYSCYMAKEDLGNLQELVSKINNKEDKERITLLQLGKSLEVTNDLKERRKILEVIYRLNPKIELYSLSYFKLLQSLGEYDLVLKLIKNSWTYLSSVSVARVALDILRSPESIVRIRLVDFVESLPQVESDGYVLLKMYSAFTKGDIELAESYAIGVMKYNELISYIFQLELANLTKDTRLMTNALNGILSARLPERSVENE